MHVTARPVALFVHHMGYILPVLAIPTTHLLDLIVMLCRSTLGAIPVFNGIS